MGFITGFTGGVTLTLALTYFTVLSHERHRQAQALALRTQSVYLETLFERSSLPPPRSRAELAREERSTLLETAKDRWNVEVESAVRWIQTKDWATVRVRMEEKVARVLGLGLERGRDGMVVAERQLGEKGMDFMGKGREVARKSVDSTANAAGRVVDEVERAVEKGRAVADGAVRRAKEI